MRSQEIVGHIDMQAFALAGNATFTIVGKSSRFTFRVRRATDDAGKAGNVSFVSILTGADNENGFQYFGLIRHELGGHRFEHGRKAHVSAAAPSAVAFKWFWQRLASGADLGVMQFWHEGKCGRCGRKLTVPESLERGLGPECAGIICEAA